MKNNKSLLIWDSAEPPPDSKEYKALWQSYTIFDSSREISIPQLVEKDADQYKAQYLAFIYDLGELKVKGKRVVDHLEIRPGFSYWWMTPLIEKSNAYKSRWISDVIKFYAINKWLKKQSFNEIKLVSSNHKLAECLKSLCKTKGNIFEYQSLPVEVKHTSWIRYIYGVLPHFFQVSIRLFKYLLLRRPLKGVGLKEWKSSKGKITFISYFDNLVPEAIKEDRFESRYWPKIPDLLQSKDKAVNWLHICIDNESSPNFKQTKELINTFNYTSKNKQIHITLDSFLNMRIIFNSLKDWMHIRRSGKLLRSAINKRQILEVFPLFENDWLDSIYNPIAINSIIKFNLFESAFKLLTVQDKGVYLQENLSWEFGMIQAWNNSNHRDLIGFPHATIRYWDLRYFFDERSYVRTPDNCIPLPDFVAVNGPVALKAYKDGKYPNKNLVEVESLRYLYLKDFDIIKHKSTKKEIHLLVAGDVLESDTYKQLDLLESAIKSIKTSVKVIFKPHPMCQINIHNYPSLNIVLESRPIYKLLTECDVVYTGPTTSVVVEAYCIGLPLITVLNASDQNASPMRGYDNIKFISTSEELAFAIQGEQKIQKPFCDKYFYLDGKLPRWKRLLFSSMENCNDNLI